MTNLFSLFYKSILCICIVLICCSDAALAQGPVEAVLSNGKEQLEKPYVILISGDGFRYDYAKKYHANNLLRLSSAGVQAKYMVPSFPSVTHSNHHSIITGLYPGHHGIVGNTFYNPKTEKWYDKSDKSWFAGESIWETASRQKMITANINWVNGRTVTKGIPRVYQVTRKVADIDTEYMIQSIENWLGMPEDTRPHLITLYFNNTDHAGHQFGPDAPETAKAVAEIDHAVGLLDSAVSKFKLPVNFIFLSDHGMINIDLKNSLPLPKIVDTNNFVVNNQNSIVNIYSKDKILISKTYNELKNAANPHFRVYSNGEIPDALHYGGPDDRFRRAGDIVLVPIWPKTFNPKPGPGMHGFDPALNKEMGATFLAWGPAFRPGMVIAPFENIEVYGILTSILGLTPSKTDGSTTVAQQIMK